MLHIISIVQSEVSRSQHFYLKKAAVHWKLMIFTEKKVTFIRMIICIRM